ncbi:low-density lipoprotein receptor-related protein 11 isoform X2 [Oncorhynchus tshawytscha]|uniref:low-density lipoprotein receptor-related protein 11 isoform X2 n=1 Tax=Oncorhynchus tshawytscha TaxID=74940 RepID=UPI000D0A1E71|nr:low-density lipoprotein receptor-related protein 11 isoform X2 [Oncorhynchus tshawytscha]
MPFNCVNIMALAQHHRLITCVLLFCIVTSIQTQFSQTLDLKPKISGMEELLEEFRKQLQQDQKYTREEEEVVDVCLADFNAVEEHIIRATASIEQGATFLSAPDRVYSWKDCLHACCADPHCTVAVVQEDMRQSDDSLSCYLFSCTYRNKNVCSFAAQAGFSTYSRAHNTTGHLISSSGNGDVNKLVNLIRRPEENPRVDDGTQMPDMDEPPRSNAGQDVVIQLPTDCAVLDGRDSVADHGVTRYEWALVKGEPAINMKVTQPGLLKISGLQEGSFTFQMTVTDTAGQKSSDNVTVTVLAPEHQAEEPCAAPPAVGPCKGIFPRWFYDPVAEECKHFIYRGCKGNHNNFLQVADCINECIKITGHANKQTTLAPPPTTKHTETVLPSTFPAEAPKVTMKWPEIKPLPERDMFPISKPHSVMGGHPGPESGAILPLALGLIITALLLLMIGCRLRLVRHKLKKARPLTTEESDYLINGMYL